ncbi:hypothetical protein ABTX60_08355 [Streptomyces sp. NPDC126510]|uniref:hypothetical protein n=1 Tax=Streptomyces sp. NPDC126510 TaxID=3155317 RepID=UPI00332C545F
MTSAVTPGTGGVVLPEGEQGGELHRTARAVRLTERVGDPYGARQLAAQRGPHTALLDPLQTSLVDGAQGDDVHLVRADPTAVEGPRDGVGQTVGVLAGFRSEAHFAGEQFGQPPARRPFPLHREDRRTLAQCRALAQRTGPVPGPGRRSAELLRTADQQPFDAPQVQGEPGVPEGEEGGRLAPWTRAAIATPRPGPGCWSGS